MPDLVVLSPSTAPQAAAQARYVGDIAELDKIGRTG